MRPGCLLVLVLAAATACDGDAGAGPGPEDYFTQLARVSENATIQERGLRRDLRVRLENAGGGEDRMDALLVYVDQSARLYEDVVDALAALEPGDEVRTAHEAYVDAWRSQRQLIVAVRDAGDSASEILDALEKPVFADAAAERRAACEDLQAAVSAVGANADLACGARSG
ncbi:MAG: hypothetical protein ACRELC_07670 [Gemmatimonadota bacterium]